MLASKIWKRLTGATAMDNAIPSLSSEDRKYLERLRKMITENLVLLKKKLLNPKADEDGGKTSWLSREKRSMALLYYLLEHDKKNISLKSLIQ